MADLCEAKHGLKGKTIKAKLCCISVYVHDPFCTNTKTFVHVHNILCTHKTILQAYQSCYLLVHVQNMLHVYKMILYMHNTLLLKTRIGTRIAPINTFAELTVVLSEEWVALGQVVVRDTVTSMHRRYVQCWDNFLLIFHQKPPSYH